ncbi:MAG: response regulator [Candidatus Scalindua rubra]|uniref:Response regulator n=1 Tax=Candidatus Scalindua rubra TaxID=1872076 RepID=A0A1E3X5A2_9BACT|nr:MAG: response regulator [Candidatus Scalindua rubra]
MGSERSQNYGKLLGAVKRLRMIESLEVGLSKFETALRRGEALPLSEVEEIFTRKALNVTKGNISVAAEKLGISRSTIYRKMQELGIRIEDYQAASI